MRLQTVILMVAALTFAVPLSAQKPPRKAASARRPAAAHTPRAAATRSSKAKPSRGGRRPANVVQARRRVRAPAAPPLPAILPRYSVGLASLRAGLDSLTTSAVRSGSWGVMVVSLSHGDTLISINGDVPHTPASTMKMLTSVLALDALGPAYRFRTDILRTGPLRDGRVDGDLIIRGDGDPSLSTRFFGSNTNAAMDSIAARVARAGVREVSGRVIGDAGAFESRSVPAGWHPRILQDAYAGKVSALSLNENLVWATVRPTAPGQPADVVLEPATTAIPVRASVKTVAGARTALRFSRVDGTIIVTGKIGVDAGSRSRSYTVDDPATFTTGAFLAALRRNGITVTGDMTMAATPTSAQIVASWESAPLETLLTVMNRESVNVIAEHVYRAAARGADRRRVGSAATADSLVRALLERSAGVRQGAIRTTDGSGLSQLDAVSPRAMVQLLAWADRAPWGRLLHASMPLAGESGTLRRRMWGTTAQTNLHAKTGTTNDVTALAGFVTARNGELLAFAVSYNGLDRERARQGSDAIGVTLANWSR